MFSGIGGFSIGLERAGMQTVAFCEVDPFCRRVLAKHWPEVKIYEDVSQLTAARLDADGICVDLICGGFPCQDVSTAGRKAGIAEGTRSGLWSDFARLIREIRPRFVIVENVAGLLVSGMGRVLGDLASLGFDAEWHCIPASAVGSPHQRDRVWIIANAASVGQPEQGRYLESVNLAPDAYREANQLVSSFSRGSLPFVCRGHDGVPDAVDRLRTLGNAVVPQIPELIGRAIMGAA